MSSVRVEVSPHLASPRLECCLLVQFRASAATSIVEQEKNYKNRDTIFRLQCKTFMVVKERSAPASEQAF